MKPYRVPISRCHCPQCGGVMPIPRKPGRSRERNHIKDMFCPYCGMVVKMVEEREDDAFFNYYGEPLTK